MVTSDLQEYLRNTLEDVKYLARSANRVRVPSFLAETPLTRQELAAEIGTSRATLGRILNELVDRGWVERAGHTYEATQVGAFVFGESTSMLDRLNSIEVLNRTARWFPEEHFGFDLRALVTVGVITTTRTDGVGPLTHVAQQVRKSDRVTILSHALFPNCIEASRNGIDNGQRMEMIIRIFNGLRCSVSE